MDKPGQLKANENIQFGRKHFEKGSILIVGDEITEKEYEALIGMGKEISVIDEEIIEKNKPASQELNEIMDMMKNLDTENDSLLKEKAALIEENISLKAEIEALKLSLKLIEPALDEAKTPAQAGKSK